MKSTNYYNTFLEVADDCPVKRAEIPPYKKEKSAAVLQFEIIAQHPYHYTMDDVVFQVHAMRKGIDIKDLEEREKFFSKGQPCLRASALMKRYGWGIHCNEEGKLALYGVGSDEYERLKKDERLQHYKAMRSSKE
jgi:hypothetical protein